MFALAPVFDAHAADAVPFDRVRVTLSRSSGIALDTTVSFPPDADSLVLHLSTPIEGFSETLTLDIAMINAAGDTVFRGGPVPVTLTTGGGGGGSVSIPVRYSGVGANARSVRIATRSASVFFRDTVALTATALDSSGAPIPGTPIAWRSLDTALARVPSDTSGRVIGGLTRGTARIEASLPTGQADTALVTVQPVPAALAVLSGGGQSAPVGTALPLPVVFRVTASDTIGVQGVVVSIAVASGGGAVGRTTDTTDASGEVSVAWTLGALLGAQSITATVVASPTLTATATATGIVGPAKTLAFTTEPPATISVSAPFAVVVTARDSLGNTATGFSGNVTVAITTGTGKAGAALRGTTTVAAVAGVASFSGLSVDSVGTGYTLTATAVGPTAATSSAFGVTAAAASGLAFTAEPPASVAAGAGFGVTVTARDAVGNVATGFTGTVTVAITGGTGKTGAALRGTTSATAVAGVATFSGLSVDSAGTAYTLTATAGGLSAGTSATFTVSVGSAVALAFTTQPPSPTGAQTPFGFVVAARDAGGNVVSAFTGAVTVVIGTNPSSGTLSGTTTQNAVAGIATFSGLSIDVAGAGYTLVASAAGLTSATSAPFTVAAAAHLNAWINAAGGNWSVASNWSKDTVPTASDTVTIVQPGTYTVNVDANATFAAITVGAPSGTQTLSVAANTLTAANGTFAPNTILDLSGTGTIAGAGTLAIGGAFNWTGGNLGVISGPGGTVRVLAGGTLSIAPTASVDLQADTLVLAGTGTWTGTATVHAGSGAALRVLAGATLAIQGDPTFSFDLGGAAPAFDVLGAVTRSTSANAAVIGVALNDSGTVNVQSGTLRLGGGGVGSGTYAVASGATLEFSGGTHTLAATSGIAGAGTVTVSGGTLSAAGPYAVTGATNVTGGAADFSGSTSSTTALTVSGGSLGGSGLLSVSGSMSWTGGNLSGAGGTAKVLSGGTLALAPAAAVSFQDYTLELDGTGTWTGTQTVNSGGGAVLRVASGGTLTIQGDPYLQFSLGGATPLFDVQGTLVRSTSLNAAVVYVPLTLSGTLSLQSGLLTLVDGGTLGGTATLSGITDLELAGGTFSLANGFRETGTGLVVTLGGTLGGLAPSDTAYFDHLQLGGGTVSLSGGTIKTALTLIWNQSTGVSGGTLFNPAGGTLTLGLVNPATLANATILNAGTAAFSTSDTLHSGSGAVIRNLPGGTFAFSAPGAYLYDQGGTASLFDNQGALSVAPSSGGAAVVSAAFANTGTVQVLTDTLRLSGGPSGTFPGTVSVSPGAVLDLGGGTFTLASPLAIGGALRVSGGTFVPNGFPVAVTGNFATAGTGALQMTQTADSLVIGGAATFAGGAGALSAGSITVGGDFVQSTNATAFAATGTQRARLDGAGTQNITFANPTTSFFRRLEIPAIGHSIVLQTNVQVTDSLTMFAGGGAATMNGVGTSQRLTVGGLLTMQQSTASPTLVPPVVELSVTPSITGGTFSPDTTVFLGTIATLPTGSGIAYKSVRVNTSGAFAAPSGNVTFNGDLIVSSGTYTTGSGIDSVGGFLRTEGTGAVSMVAFAASPTVAVADSAVFAGGPSTSLTGGVLRLWGNFVERGTGGQFAASGSHQVTFQRAVNGSQTVQLADSVNSYFHDLTVNGTVADTLRLLSNVEVQDSAVLAGTSALVSNATEALKLPLAGILRVHSQAILQPFRVEAGTWVLDSTFIGGNYLRFSPDTAVALNATTFNGGSIASTPAPLFAWKSLRLESGTLTSSGTDYSGDLIVEGSARYALSTAGVTDSVAGKLRTLGTGAIEMNVGTAPPTVTVGDSALFGGGSETDLIASGTLILYGSFVQSGATTSFVATTGHTTVFAGAGQQTVTFASPGSSTFGNLAIERSSGGVSQSAGITLGSSITVAGLLEDSTVFSGATDSIAGNGFGVVANGLSLGSQFVMNDAPLATTGSSLVFSGLTFRNMSPTVTQWTIDLPVGAQAAVSGLNFQTVPTTGGLYFSAFPAASGSATLIVSSALPATLTAGQYSRTNGSGSVTVDWNSSPLP